MQVESLVNFVCNFKGPSPRGLDCKFIKLNERWGIKAYTKKHIRDKAFEAQSNMFCYNHAPETGVCFDVKYPTMYCYTTEIAIPLVEAKTDEENYLVWEKKYNIVQRNPVVIQEMHELAEKMRVVGYNMQDIHACNFGKLKGNLVCIDFGDAVWDED